MVLDEFSEYENDIFAENSGEKKEDGNIFISIGVGGSNVGVEFVYGLQSPSVGKIFV
jgi:hypothetical protein